VISSQSSAITYDGNASTALPYEVPFRFDETSWLIVQEIGANSVVTLLVLGTDYTVAGNGVTTSGHVVTHGRAIPETSKLRIARNTPATQTVNLSYSGAIPSSVLESMADKRTMGEIDEARRSGSTLSRSLRFADGVISDDPLDNPLEEISARVASSVLTLDSGGNPVFAPRSEFQMGPEGPQGDPGTPGGPTDFGSGVPGAGYGSNGDVYVDYLTGIIYRKSSGTWAAVSSSLGNAVYAVTATPANGFGTNGDLGLVYTGGLATSLVTKSGGTWSTLAAIGVSLAETRADQNLRSGRRVPLYPYTTNKSGSGGVVLADGGIAWICNIDAVSAAWGRVVLAKYVTGFPTILGAGINYGQAFAFDFSACIATTAAGLGGKVRFVMGDTETGTPPLADAHPSSSAKMIGVEFAYDGGLPDCRIFAYNAGPTPIYSGWSGSAASSIGAWTHCRLINDGAGNLSLYLGVPAINNNGIPVLASTPVLTLSGGPTGNGSASNSYVTVQALAPTSAAPPSGSIQARGMGGFIEML